MTNFCFAQYHAFPIYDGSNRMIFYNNYSGVQKTKVEKVSRKHQFIVRFTNGKIDTLFGKVDEHKGNFYLAVEKPSARAIKPIETLKISRLDTTDTTIYTGVPVDSCCWSFRVVSGTLSIYSLLPEPHPAFQNVIQKGSDEPLPLDRSNVLKLIPTPSREMMNFINDYRLDKAVIKYNLEQAKEKKQRGGVQN
jgi:hypothetical protein